MLDQVKADSTIIVVEFQLPGGFANIPSSRRQALNGGSINLGLLNLTAGVLAHEIGHTLGSGHDYSDASSSFFDLLPDYGSGNHFIGAVTGKCYRTIMSALINCRISGFEGQPAINSNRFSSSRHSFGGTLTGDAIKTDHVRAFEYFGPLVASARGDSQLPEPTPTVPPSDGTPSPPNDDDDDGSNDEGGDDDGMEDNWGMLTLKITKNKGKTLLQDVALTRIPLP